MKHNLKVILMLITVLLASELFGLFVVKSYSSKDLPYGFEPPEVDERFSPVQFLIMVGLATLLIFVLKKIELLGAWKLWFIIAITLATSISFSAFIPSTYALLAALAIAILRVRSGDLYVKNLSEVLMYGGIVVVFSPIFSPLTAFILLLALSAYDVFSVFFSGHMVNLVKLQERIGVFSGIMIRHREGRALLGGGDIALPLLFAATVFEAMGFLSALLVIYFSVLAIFLLLLLGKEEKYYPALPVITAGAGLGYLIALL